MVLDSYPYKYTPLILTTVITKNRSQKSDYIVSSSYVQFFRYKVLEIYLMEAQVGLEPTTDGLQNRCATNCATEP